MGHFGVTLGSLLVCGVDFGSLWDHFGMIVESLWYIKVHCQKTIIFPIDSNDFIKLRGQLDVAFGVTFGV